MGFRQVCLSGERGGKFFWRLVILGVWGVFLCRVIELGMYRYLRKRFVCFKLYCRVFQFMGQSSCCFEEVLGSGCFFFGEGGYVGELRNDEGVFFLFLFGVGVFAWSVWRCWWVQVRRYMLSCRSFGVVICVFRSVVTVFCGVVRIGTCVYRFFLLAISGWNT